MTPFHKFLNGLQAAQLDMNEMLNELRAFAEIMARKQNSIELDENGFFYVTAAGKLEDVIPTVEQQLQRLKRMDTERSSGL